MFWPNGSGPEASRFAGITGPSSGRSVSTGPLPVSQFPTPLRSCTDTADQIVQNQPGSDLVLADCVRFWTTEPVPKQTGVQESSSRAHLWPTLPSRSGSDANRIRHVYWAYLSPCQSRPRRLPQNPSRIKKKVSK